MIIENNKTKQIRFVLLLYEREKGYQKGMDMHKPKLKFEQLGLA